jgi:hypothetical protein
MRLPIASLLHQFLQASHDVACTNALQNLEDMALRRREHDEVETFIHELQRELVQSSGR